MCSRGDILLADELKTRILDAPLPFALCDKGSSDGPSSAEPAENNVPPQEFEKAILDPPPSVNVAAAGDCVFPLELEREMFELAAFLYSECMSTLMLVAHRIKIWIEPILYRTLIIHPRIHDPKFPYLSVGAVERLINLNPRALRHTRNICLVGVQAADRLEVTNFLSRCGAVVNLAFIRTSNFRVPHGDVLSILPLRRLSFSLRNSCFWRPNPFGGGTFDRNHSFFSRITHLDILSRGMNFLNWEEWAGLARIPQLTHLSTHPKISYSVLRGVLEHCTRLEVLVVRYCDEDWLDKAMALGDLTDDLRFVRLLVGDDVGDWETGARGGEDYWARATAIVKKRLLGGK
ncbi:hypothetical protein K438DRAFT_2017569 [Mycena galopus ATCC 62051]|nr:hypothetical protein K438DRAFT_2017569 [Mycena galopus ATCC 62051]